MEIALPKMGASLVMMMTMISPSGREVPPAESLCRRAKVLVPKFCLETAALHPESLLLIFLGQNHLYTRRGAPEVGQGGHNPPGRARGPGGPRWVNVVPTWWAPLEVICSNIPHEVSACLECKIGSLTYLFQVQISSCQNSPSWCVPCNL